MGVKLQSALGGSVELNAPSTASNFTMTVPTTNGTVATTDQLAGSRNRIINGDMRIAQRGTAAVTVNDAATFKYPVDRFIALGTASAGVYTAQQSTVAPAGFNNSLQATVTTASTPSAAHGYSLLYHIEGFNVADFGFGTANAQTVTLSFWVRSSVTGTFGGSLRNTLADRSYTFSYTISAANTWEQKSITVPGDTSGTWDATNGLGMRLAFSLGRGSGGLGAAGSWTSNNFTGATGQTNLIQTNGATFYITGVQLEAGSVATPFERRPYGTELALCQRYYYQYTAATQFGQNGGNLGAGYSTYFGFTIPFKVSMRTNPTIVQNMSLSTDSVGTVVYAANEENYTVNHGNMSGLYSYWSGTFKVSAEL
jgi:hypothetical protein